MHTNEKRQLKRLVDAPIWEALKGAGAIIAGGAITSLFTGQEVNDLDVYLPDQRAVVDILAFAFGEQDYCNLSCDEGGIATMQFHNMTEKSMMFRDSVSDQEIQLVLFKYFDSAEDIFETFDFTCCMGAFDLQEDEFILHPEFLKHNSQKYLKFNPSTAYPLISALRIDKYKKKGYNISKPEFLSVVLKCMEMDIEDWESFREHIGGMYGYNTEELFDEDQEFSLSEAIHQLQQMETCFKDYGTQILGNDFNKILEKFDPAPEVCDEVTPFRAGYYYKRVNSNYQSIYCGSGRKIEYSIGCVVNGGEHGIYIDSDPTNPYCPLFNSYRLLELKPLTNMESSKPSKLIPASCRQSRVVGDLRVIREIDYIPSLSNSQRKYRITEDA